MNNQVLGFACLATLTASTAAALEHDLQIAGSDYLVASVELLNQHYDEGLVIHDDTTARGHFTGRWYDIGLHIDAFIALDGNETRAPEPVSTGELTEFTARLDYLLEITDIIQILPHFETTVYPDISGKTRWNWVGVDVWYMLPWEGLELGGSADYNLADEGAAEGENEHAWRGAFGARQFYQNAPLDLSFWQLFTLGSRSYHQRTSGVDNQGLTTLNLGAKITLPLPWETTWTFLRLEGFWWLESEDRDALQATGREPEEVIIGIGFESRM